MASSKNNTPTLWPKKRTFIVRLASQGHWRQAMCMAAIILTVPFASARPNEATTVLPLGLPTPGPALQPLTLVDLGAYLFQAKQLSSDGSTSCESCHKPELGFSGDQELAVGVGGFRTKRHAPPLINLYLLKAFMADGSAATLEKQHALPLESQEMRVNWPNAVSALDADPLPTRLRQAAGVGPFSRESIIHAIAAYVGSLVSGNSRFDRYYYGHDQKALTDDEKSGLRLFVRKGRCSSCHLLDGIAAPFTDGNFHSTGVGFKAGAYDDHGRMDFTSRAADDGLFMTPTLRNVALRRYMMHDGSMTSLKQVIEFYNKGGVASARNRDPRIRPLFLSELEITQLTLFLSSLTSDIYMFSGPYLQTP